jgi:hypothetical protein
MVWTSCNFKYHKMRFLILFIFIFTSGCLLSQSKELEFKVIKPKVEITVSPSYNFLYQNISHPIKVEIKDTLHHYIVKLAGGTYTQTDTGTFITPEAKSEAILNLYEVKKGTEILVGSKRYIVLPEPKPYLRNKPTDNVLLDMLLVSGTLKGISMYKQKKIVLPVKSFTVVYKGNNDSFKSVDVVGDQMPVPIRKEIGKLSNGAMIYFEKINVELFPGCNVLIQPYRVTMEVIEGGVTNYGIGGNK